MKTIERKKEVLRSEKQRLIKKPSLKGAHRNNFQNITKSSGSQWTCYPDKLVM